MKIMIEPSTAWCNDEGNEGITSTVVLTTSHCAMHIWNFPEPNESVLQFDLYSCAPFTAVEVIEFIGAHFDITSAKYKFLDREDGFVELDNGRVSTGFARLATG
jgi:S-adenosylmethionine/arginine decarboxylase-like enzyme